MPSKNSINRPKLVTNLKNKAQKAGLKRSRRDQRGDFQPARSSETSKSGEIKSVALDLYFQDEKTGGSITNKTLSKKRAKKIERNLKYAQQRKLLTDLQAKVENDMDVDTALVKKVKETKDSKLSMIKKAMWNVLDDTQSQQNLPLSSSGQGTTLGGAWFP
ncbi:ribosome biogenesis protein Alb1p [Monosporozyma unispora]|nr:ribosome biogenesis protein alb1 [Kazachstania unispora]